MSRCIRTAHLIEEHYHWCGGFVGWCCWCFGSKWNLLLWHWREEEEEEPSFKSKTSSKNLLVLINWVHFHGRTINMPFWFTKLWQTFLFSSQMMRQFPLWNWFIIDFGSATAAATVWCKFLSPHHMSNIFKIIQYEEEEKMMAKFLKTGLFELQHDKFGGWPTTWWMYSQI